MEPGFQKEACYEGDIHCGDDRSPVRVSAGLVAAHVGSVQPLGRNPNSVAKSA
jgi:hypothetical protein